MIRYHHQVIEQGPGIYRTLYDGDDHADAMGAWSKAIGDGVEYVTLESLKDRRGREAGSRAAE